jgi:oxaloacetate decarboxylase alpha subunit
MGSSLNVIAISPQLPRLHTIHARDAIDFTSSTHMAVSVRYHTADPFERLRLVRAAMPVTPLGFITTGMRFISWERSEHPAV